MFWWRPDADLVRDVSLTRRIMPLVMRKRNESAVYFEQQVDIARAKAFLDEIRAKGERKPTLLHLFLFAAARTLHERPRLNRFTAGGRLWQRRGIWASFSAKREKSDASPIIVVKRELDPSWTFEELVDRIESDVKGGRAHKTSTEKELGLLFLLPTLLLSLAVRAVMWLDHIGLLPGFFLRSDPMFASFFVANLGSLKMDAAFHHLYEYGNIPIFAVVGRAAPEVVAGKDGAPVVKELVTLRYTFDERVEDGLYCLKALERLREIVEDPAAFTTTR